MLAPVGCLTRGCPLLRPRRHRAIDGDRTCALGGGARGDIELRPHNLASAAAFASPPVSQGRHDDETTMAFIGTVWSGHPGRTAVAVGDLDPDNALAHGQADADGSARPSDGVRHQLAYHQDDLINWKRQAPGHRRGQRKITRLLRGRGKRWCMQLYQSMSHMRTCSGHAGAVTRRTACHTDGLDYLPNRYQAASKPNGAPAAPYRCPGLSGGV